jgi:predicted Zn-dependent protease
MDIAKRFATEALAWMPEKTKWRVYLELADLAKRSNQVKEARKLYKKVCVLQPLASQGWLEWSKMEEECGNLGQALKILKRGLRECQFNESLLTKAIKQVVDIQLHSQ